MISSVVVQLGAVASLIALGALAARLYRARRAGGGFEVVSRPLLVAAAALVLGAPLVVAYGYSTSVAAAGDRAIRAASERPEPDAPARARVFLRAVQLAPPGGERATFRVGFSPRAELALPRHYNLGEAYQRRDLFRVEVIGKRRLAITSEVASDSTTRVVTGGGLAARGDVEAACQSEAAAQRSTECRHSRCAAILCNGDTPVAALEFRQELAAADVDPGDVPLLVEPWVWNGRRLRRHHLQLEAGQLIQIGATVDALPGLTIWEVPAPSARPALMFPPDDILGRCRDWTSTGDRRAGFFYHPSLGGTVQSPGREGGEGFACLLPFVATQPFALEVRRLFPDVDGNTTRALWAALLLVAPAFGWLLALIAARPSARQRARVCPALALGLWSASLASLAVLRLLWAHRLDMLRHYVPVGPRVIDNQLLVVCTGAALAMAAVLLAGAGLGGRWRRWAAALVAWAAWLGLGLYALSSDLAAIGASRALYFAAASLAVGAAPQLWPRLNEVLADAAGGRLSPPRLAAAAMAVVCLFTAGGAIAGVSSVIAKLALAALLVSIFYLGLRAAAVAGDALAAGITAALGLVALAALAAIDTGIAAVYGGVGVVLGLVLAGFDALHAASDRRQLGNYETWLAPVVTLLSAAAVVLGAVLILLTVVPGWWPSPSAFTGGALIALGILPVLLSFVAMLVLRRRGLELALPWIASAAVSLAAWLARGPLLGALLGSGREAARRIAAVLDPAYAILQDDVGFSRSLTAWREASLAVPGRARDAAELVSGQGFFGAQVVDPGVLLSVDNDYLPVLIVRELGAFGLATTSLLLLTLMLAGLWVARARFARGSAGSRWRTIAAVVAVVAIGYQPIASLGALPFTGVSLLGLGIDSPADWWTAVLLLAFLTLFTGEPGAELGTENHDEVLDRDRPSRWPAIAAGVLSAAMVASTARAGIAALTRPAPVSVEEAGGAEPGIRFAPAFEELAYALDYAFRLQCPDDRVELPDPTEVSAAIPAELLGAETPSAGVARFDRELARAWQRDRALALRRAGRFAAGDAGACSGREGQWRFQLSAGERCEMRWSLGWPQVEIELAPGAGGTGELVATCEVEIPSPVLRTLRYPVKRPFAGARIRLVSRAMGRAAADVAELVAGNVILRLRPGAGEVDLADARGGVYVAERARLGGGLEVVIGGESGEQRAMLVRDRDAGVRPATVLTYESSGSRIYAFEPERGRWRARRLAGGEEPTGLERLAVIVTGARRGRTVWLFRRASVWPGSEGRATVNPLLADDVATVLGANRRFYLYGGLIPELGWVNPWSDRKSLGLDGWVRAALARFSRDGHGRDPLPRWYCPVAPARSAGSIDPVCARSPVDGVVECRVALQPELAVRLRHILELSALRPETLVEARPPKPGPRPSVSASLALIRGDTGEIVAQSHFVPGRESSAYAPATPSLEKYLIDAREDRDPVTGRRLPAEETGAEKVGWNQPVAVGSVLKPLLARAAERADRDWLSNLHLGTELRREPCASGVAPILGYCPRTRSLWNHPAASADVVEFLGRSLNWFQAGLGLLATGIGGDISIDTSTEVVQVGALATDDPLVIRHRGRQVLGPEGVDASALRETPMWEQLEAVVGRPMCSLGDKQSCRKQSERRDLCAARALPIAAPSRDLRHLVALGPSSFDFFPEGRRAGRRIPVVEYLELLRGSGAHPLGSALQIADAYARVFFARADAEAAIAASWFPVPATGNLPSSCGGSPSSPTQRGLCRVLDAGGTASKLGVRLKKMGVIAFGAKTGTIDSLGDVAESTAACERFNLNHTVPGSERQPFHLECGTSGGISDSLVVVGFGVPSPEGVVPLVLVLRYQGVGMSGFAAAVADLFVGEIARYFGRTGDDSDSNDTD